MFEKQQYPIISRYSLNDISCSHSLRCDAKQSEKRFLELRSMLMDKETCYLSEFLPKPLVKGSQPAYLQEGDGVPVINTLSIQKMKINTDDCRIISEDDFINLIESRKLKANDVLLTMDGGTSIGKPVLFNLEGDYTVDSHVAILRPEGISPNALVFLLASPLGQLQFQMHESGASGQTAVTEEDLRRFLIPRSAIAKLEEHVKKLIEEKESLDSQRELLEEKERCMWESFTANVLD